MHYFHPGSDIGNIIYFTDSQWEFRFIAPPSTLARLALGAAMVRMARVVVLLLVRVRVLLLRPVPVLVLFALLVLFTRAFWQE